MSGRQVDLSRHQGYRLHRMDVLHRSNCRSCSTSAPSKNFPRPWLPVQRSHPPRQPCPITRSTTLGRATVEPRHQQTTLLNLRPLQPHRFQPLQLRHQHLPLRPPLRQRLILDPWRRNSPRPTAQKEQVRHLAEILHRTSIQMQPGLCPDQAEPSPVMPKCHRRNRPSLEELARVTCRLQLLKE